MGLLGGGILRLGQTALYGLDFLCAGVILGIYSSSFSVLANRDLPIATYKKAVEGISGVAVVYTILAVILTCFLGGVSFFAFIAILIDILLVGGFIAIAVLTRQGSHSCSGTVNTPLGNGPVDSSSGGYGSNGFGFGSGETVTYAPKLGLACKLNKAVFIVACIGAFLFLLTALFQLALVRHHKKEKRFGPSPANNYTSGSGQKRKFWQRKPKNDNNITRDAELGAVGAGGLAVADHHHNKNVRPSHDTAFTDTTAVNNNTYDDTTGHNTHLNRDAEIGTAVAAGEGRHPHNITGSNVQQNAVYGLTPTDQQHGYQGTQHSGYHTQPTGTGVSNPYGYENTYDNANTRTTGTNF